ncbi:MAG: hypothetical protein K1X53_08375 [Candidatus Sumerlaeaceae bacterium]|nr:hypothetical protein [Candidatus Sumerlaeaceae bacterium]
MKYLAIGIMLGALAANGMADKATTGGGEGKAKQEATKGAVSVQAKGGAQADRQPLAGAAFDKKLDAMGIKFHVLATSGTATNKLQIIPSGLKGDNIPILRDIEGVVKDCEWGDINSDGSPEVYVFVASAGPDANDVLVAYSANNKKSLSEIYLSPVADDPKLSKGFHGHADIAVVENVVALRFPIYEGTGAEAKPTGKTRQVQYKLKPGEAGWKLKVDKVVEY